MIAIHLPRTWDNLSPRQFKQIASILFQPLEPLVRDMAIFAALYQVRWWQFKRYYRLKNIIRNYSLEDLKEHYSFIYDKTNRLDFLPCITIKGTDYFPPKRFLYNLTIAEFAVVDDIYMQLKGDISKGIPIHKQRENLETLCAILYQQDHKHLRTTFKKELLETLEQPWRKCDIPTMLTAFITYQGCRMALEKRYTRVFTNGGGKSTQRKKYGFGKVILNMAGQKFGTHAETAQTYVHTFLEQLNEDLTPEKLK